MYGQQSLMPLISAVTWGFGGGQLIEAALAGHPYPAAVPWVPSSASFRCRICGPVHAVHAGGRSAAGAAAA